MAASDARTLAAAVTCRGPRSPAPRASACGDGWAWRLVSDLKHAFEPVGATTKSLVIRAISRWNPSCDVKARKGTKWPARRRTNLEHRRAKNLRLQEELQSSHGRLAYALREME